VLYEREKHGSLLRTSPDEAFKKVWGVWKYNMETSGLHYKFYHLWVCYKLTRWPGPSWLDDSVGRALHLFFVVVVVVVFQAISPLLIKLCVLNCNGQACLYNIISQLFFPVCIRLQKMHTISYFLTIIK